MTEMGQTRSADDDPRTTASAPQADIAGSPEDVAEVPEGSGPPGHQSPGL